jgi:cell division protein FtsB
MSRRPAAAPPAPEQGSDGTPRTARSQPSSRADRTDRPASADLGSLSVAGLTRHRVLVLAVLLAVGWLAFAFVRQVGDVTAASGRAEALAAANRQLASDITALDGELRLIQRQEFIVQEARAYRLGAEREVPFSLQKPLPSLAPDAPGSAGVRVGADSQHRSPLESWLTLLFGPAS